MHPGITVIMAVHNEPPSILEAAISSILSQSIKNIEFIICDDGSDCETAEALKKLIDGTGIILIRNDCSLGAGVARNRALALAQGQYIAIMDADDISDNMRLEKEREFLINNSSYAFVGCIGKYFRITPGDMHNCYWFVEKPEPQDFLMTLPFVHASILFRRSALDVVGGYREIQRVKRSEDYDLLLRLYENHLYGANLPEMLYHIRMNDATFNRRKYRFRFYEALVKAEGFARLGLMPKGIIYAIKPLIVGLIPNRILEPLKHFYYLKKENKVRRRHGF